MNKSDLILKLAERTDIGAPLSEEVVKLIVDHMREALIERKRIEIRGFGSFMVKEYGSYTGRNPKTGEPIVVEEKCMPTFKVGKELRERLNLSK
jgi:integration host factor subunit beta